MLMLAAETAGFEGFSGPSALFLAGGVGAGVGWLLLLAWRWVATYPKLPDAGPAVADLGPEPPAIVNLLVNRWKLTRSAMAATILDLAARHFLAIDLVAADFCVVRLKDPQGDGQPLTDYERQALDHVRSRATGGSAPIDAIGLGDEGDVEAWWKRFSKSVAADARQRGLARTRWAPSDLSMLSGSLAVALAFLVLAFGSAHLGESSDFDQWDWIWVGIVAWVAIMAAIGASRDIRDTPAGRAVAARWLGVHDYLRANNPFDDVPPAGVTVWERWLSQGVALGLAHDAAAAFPFEPEDPNSAWSRYGGSWHEVRISYPQRFGACQSPGHVLLVGAGSMVLWGALCFVALPWVAKIAFEIATDAFDSSGEERALLLVFAPFLAMFVGAGIYLAARFLGGVIRAWRGLLDLGRYQRVEGQVVKVHAGRVAVDDGKSRELVAWLPPPGAPGLGRGMLVSYLTTKRLHHVAEVQARGEA